eukprot:5957853-Pyramimonas_sp.AAC.1
MVQKCEAVFGAAIAWFNSMFTLCVVLARAQHLCEYLKISEWFTPFRRTLEEVIAGGDRGSYLVAFGRFALVPGLR